MRLAHAETNDEGMLKSFADSQIAPDTQVVTDGHAGYNSHSLGERSHEAIVQTKAERRQSDALQGCHWTTSLLKRWLLGTHAGAVRPKHLQAYLDEFAFRHNRRKTNRVGRIALPASSSSSSRAGPCRCVGSSINLHAADGSPQPSALRQPDLNG